MNDSERIVEFIKQTTQDMEHADISLCGLSDDYKQIGDAVVEWLKQVQEVYRFTCSMADGKLTEPIPHRDNFMAGPIKDLYYKIQHLRWQTYQISKGDYSQHVDFMGDFSDAFNSMTLGLKTREETINLQAEEKISLMNKEKIRLERQLERQQAHFAAYRRYTSSFQSFRSQYKLMMGEVYNLFNQGRYEEGRQCIVKINDMMGNDVSISKEYSNNDYINTLLMDVASYCQQHEITFEAIAQIPQGLINEDNYDADILLQWIELIYLLLESSSVPGRSLTITSTDNPHWISILARYDYVSEKSLVDNSKEFSLYMQDIQKCLDDAGAILDFRQDISSSELVFIIHLPKNS